MSNGSRWRVAAFAASAAMPNRLRFSRPRRSSFSSVAAGGPTDVVRASSASFCQRAGAQTVVIENRPVPARSLQPPRSPKRPADGLTLLVATNSLLINPAIAKLLPSDTVKDLAPVTMIAVQPVALVATKSFAAAPWRTSSRRPRSADQLHLARPAGVGVSPARC